MPKPPSVTVTDPDGSTREVHAKRWFGGWLLDLNGGSLLPGTRLPDGLRVLYLYGGTLPAGTVLPESLEYLGLRGGSLPGGTRLPESLVRLYLDGGTLPHGTAVPAGCEVWGVGPEGIHGRAPVNAKALLAKPPSPRPAIDLWI